MGAGLQLNKEQKQDRRQKKKKKYQQGIQPHQQKQGTGYGEFLLHSWNPHLLSPTAKCPPTLDRTAASSDRNWRSGCRLFSNHRRYGTDDKGRKANKKKRASFLFCPFAYLVASADLRSLNSNKGPGFKGDRNGFCWVLCVTNAHGNSVAKVA